MWVGDQLQLQLMWAGDQFQLQLIWADDQFQFQLMWTGDQLQLVSYSKELLNSFKPFNRTIVTIDTGNNVERKKCNIIIHDRTRYAYCVNSQTLEHVAILEWSGVTRSWIAGSLIVVGLSTRERENSDGHAQFDREAHDGVLLLNFSWWKCWAPKVTSWLRY